MMKRFKNGIQFFFFLAPLVAGLMPIPVNFALAQTDDCTISPPIFRVNKGNPSDDDFYEETDRPYVYIDIQTDCPIGTSLQFSLTGQIAGGLTGISSIGALDDYVLVIGPATANQSEFTIVMRAGEQICSAAQMPNCQYYAEVNGANVDGIESFSSVPFEYACEDQGIFDLNSCNDGSNWDSRQILPYMNSLDSDPHFNGTNPTSNTIDTTPTASGDNSNAPSIINLNLPNPLAGTVDNLPSLFQQIVNIIISIGVPLVAMAIVYSGFLFVSARGSDEDISKAKAVFTYAIIGGLILLASWLVAEAIMDALTSLATNP